MFPMDEVSLHRGSFQYIVPFLGLGALRRRLKNIEVRLIARFHYQITKDCFFEVATLKKQTYMYLRIGLITTK